MKLLTRMLAAGLVFFTANGPMAFAQPAPAPASAKVKNWTPPAHKIYAQTLADEIMAKHPELISVTLQGVPPGMSKVYTMFAGSFPERIGNASDPDDIMVVDLGISIVDPRWRKTKDPIKKFVVLTPLRDATSENVGLIVFAFKNDPQWNKGKSEVEFLAAASAIRDTLKARIPNYDKLFERVN